MSLYQTNIISIKTETSLMVHIFSQINTSANYDMMCVCVGYRKHGTLYVLQAYVLWKYKLIHYYQFFTLLYYKHCQIYYL